MAPSFSIIFLLISLLSTSSLARDSQFFNKLPSSTTTPNTNTNAAKPEQEPDFVPDNENSYGLYGHETGQFPPSTTTTSTSRPDSKYLPKNYNPVAYVTEPEDFTDSASLAAEEKTSSNSYATNPTNYNNAATDFYDPRQENDESAAYRSYPTTTTSTNDDNNNLYYNVAGSSFNTDPQGTRFYGEPQGTRFNGVNGNYYNNNNGFQAEEFSGEDGRESYNFDSGVNGFRPQGMSDTRMLENGKYFYNVNSEKFSENHPYEMLKGARPTNVEAGFGVNGEFP